MEDQTHMLSLIAAYEFGKDHGLGAEMAAIKNIAVNDMPKRASGVRRGYVVHLFEEHGILDEFCEKHWAVGKTPKGESLRRRYLKRWRGHQAILKGSALELAPISYEESDDASTESAASDAQALSFALESHLRDFIAKNIRDIRPTGIPLTLYRDSSGREGVEYPTDVGPIDILAQDSSGNLFVFELKLDRGPDRAVGQLLRYMGWIRKHLSADKSVNGVIVAGTINEKLKYAVSIVPSVKVFEYRMRFDLSPVALE